MPLVFGVCMKYFKNETKAKDATMSIYETCVEKCLSSDIKQFKPWLYVVVKNHCLMQLRKESRVPKEIELDDNKVDEVNGYDFLRDERINILIQKLDQLKPDQKNCLTLFFLKNKSYQEVSIELGLELKTVKSHIQNGKRNLKIVLEQEDAFKN